MICKKCDYIKNELELVHEDMQILKKRYIKLSEEFCKLQMISDATRNQKNISRIREMWSLWKLPKQAYIYV